MFPTEPQVLHAIYSSVDHQEFGRDRVGSAVWIDAVAATCNQFTSGLHFQRRLRQLATDGLILVSGEQVALTHQGFERLAQHFPITILRKEDEEVGRYGDQAAAWRAMLRVPDQIKAHLDYRVNG